MKRYFFIDFRKKYREKSGFTLIELLICIGLLSIISMGILPISKYTYIRLKEIKLRQNLRIIRNAIDEYKEMSDEKKIEIEFLSSGYPKNIKILATGVQLFGVDQTPKKILRRIPMDPMAKDGIWGFRSYADPYDSEIWGGQDVYDVYSKSNKRALDGSYYKNW